YETDIFDTYPWPEHVANADGRGNGKQRGHVWSGIDRLSPFGSAHRLLRDRIARELFPRDDVDADIAGTPHQVMHHGAVQDLEPARPRRLADDDLRDVVGVGERDNVIGDATVAARNGDRLAAQRLAQPQRVGDAVALDLAPLQAAPRLHAQRGEGGVQPVRQAFGIAHEASRPRVLADADQDALARGPRPGNRMRLHMREQLLVHALGR